MNAPSRKAFTRAVSNAESRCSCRLKEAMAALTSLKIQQGDCDQLHAQHADTMHPKAIAATEFWEWSKG